MKRFKIQDLGFRNGIFILILTTYFFLPASTINAANSSELEQQIEQVRREREVLIEEQKKLEAELEAVNRESRSLGSTVKSLDATRKKLAKDISITRSRITSTDLTIRSLENTMGEKERQIAVHRKAITNALLTLSEYDSRPLILDILAYAQLSDVWGDRSELESFNMRLTEEVDALRETRRVLNQEKEQKEKIKKEQVSLAGQLSGQKSVVEENQKAKAKLLAETRNKETEYQKLLAENLANQKQFDEDLFRLESELRITLDPSLIPSPRRGLLSWPLVNIYITDPFGVRPTRFHKGVDFRASQGTTVKAMLLGTVEGMGNTDEMNAELRRAGKPICGSYGRWILIKHNNGLSSIYAHLSASIVKIGQSLETGEIIGYSGGTPGVNGSGYSTGPHLHVGLLASQGVQIRQFTTSRNCKHISLPIADPKAYLDPLAYLPVLQ